MHILFLVLYDFWVFQRFVTPIKGCRVMDSFMLLASFKFLVDVYGYALSDVANTRLF